MIFFVERVKNKVTCKNQHKELGVSVVVEGGGVYLSF